MVTTAIAIVIGFAVASVVQPGIGMALPGEAAPKVKEAPTTREQRTTGTIIILIRLINMVPTGAIHALTGPIAPSPRTRPTTTESTNDAKI